MGGMPSKRHHLGNSKTEYGDLYVQCNVQIPTSATSRRKKGVDKLTKEERMQLGTLLDKLFHESSSSNSNIHTTPNTTDEKDAIQLEENASIHNFGLKQERQNYEEDGHNHFFSDDEEDNDFPY